MTTMTSQITSLTIVYSTVYSDADQRKHQSSASLAFVWGIPRTKGQLRGKFFHLMTSSWYFSIFSGEFIICALPEFYSRQGKSPARTNKYSDVYCCDILVIELCHAFRGRIWIVWCVPYVYLDICGENAKTKNQSASSSFSTWYINTRYAAIFRYQFISRNTNSIGDSFCSLPNADEAIAYDNCAVVACANIAPKRFSSVTL